jgi:hypothetical protein
MTSSIEKEITASEFLEMDFEEGYTIGCKRHILIT